MMPSFPLNESRSCRTTSIVNWLNKIGAISSVVLKYIRAILLLIFKAEIDRRQNEYEKLGSLISNGQIFLNYLAHCILGNEKNIIVYCYFLQYLKPTLIISRVGLYYNTYVVHCTYVPQVQWKMSSWLKSKTAHGTVAICVMDMGWMIRQ